MKWYAGPVVCALIAIFGAPTAGACSVDGVPSLSLALRMLKEQAERTPAPQWVRVVGGWSEFQFAERRMPTLDEINAAAPHTPVFILHLYCRALLNQAALDGELQMCTERGASVVIGAPFASGILAIGAREGATYGYAPAQPCRCQNSCTERRYEHQACGLYGDRPPTYVLGLQRLFEIGIHIEANCPG